MTQLTGDRHAALRAVFRGLCKLPGVKTLARTGSRLAIRRLPLSMINRQRVFNFFAADAGAGVRIRTSIPLPFGGAVAAELNLDEDMDRTWYFWGYSGYERGVPEFLLRLTSERNYQTIIEVGANVGYFTLLLGTAVALNGPGTRVHAFEPFNPVFEQLNRNVALNPRLPITLHRAAVTDADGVANLFIPTDERAKTNASLIAGPFEQTGSDTVASVRLDSFSDNERLGRIDLLKMDCEGAEPSAVRGACHLLSECRPDVLCEVLPATAVELNHLFSRLPYHKYHITEAEPVLVDRLIADPRYRDYFLTTKPLVPTSL